MSLAIILAMVGHVASLGTTAVHADQLMAGAAKVDITNRDAGPVNDPLFVKALVIKGNNTTAVIVTVDAVAIGEIGHIKNDYLPKVRAQLEKELNILPTNVLVNASHCHGVVAGDVDQRTVQAVKAAASKLVPVKVGVGVGHEDRIMINRRMKMTNGPTIDVRHAYSLPPDEQIEAVGPIDPQIGILRFDRLDGRTLAVVYNFACHPIQGVPGGANTADILGYASQVIEDNLSEGTIALFLQGCGGDINPIRYKNVHHPRSAEPLGHMLGLSTLKALRKIQTPDDAPFKIINEKLTLPLADNTERIAALQAERDQLQNAFGGTSLNLKTFLALMAKYKLAGDYPSADASEYLHEKGIGREHYHALDTDNRANMARYMQNIYTMEQLTRVRTNLALLKKHHKTKIESGKDTLDVEVVGLRLGDFVLITFPGELTVQIGLNIKKASPHQHTFVAGYTNGYIYYCPTAEQLKNVGGAQEDSDCRLAPEWQKLFENKVAQMLKKL